MDEINPAASAEDEAPATGDSIVPLVAVGASAGGLEALRELVGKIPADLGACFVVVQHLDPTHKSMLTELLARSTELPVEVATDGAPVKADHIMVIPENSTLRLSEGRLRLEHPAPPRNIRTPIDTFLRSVAAELGDRAVAIILSGTGSDGMQGVKALKEAGGYILVQEPKTAAYDSMPRNAIATGLVDVVLPPKDMPGAVADYLRHLRDGTGAFDFDGAEVRQILARICQQLKIATGHDFRQYKEPTLMRRVQRRMQVLRIERLENYADLLRADQKEARQLFRELLISVTTFFRDPAAFEALEAAVDEILAGKQKGETLRVWVAGCATGEEAYSLAILLRDKVDQLDAAPPIQIFATDIDESALAVARRGIYPESIADYVPEVYLKRYFRQVGAEFQLTDEIRELCIFSTQSLIKDPPFSRLDLLSCRNVLIYMKPELQDRLIPMFHYALKPNGCLLLGPSESITGHEGRFESIDRKWRLFRRRPTTEATQPRFPLMNLAPDVPAVDRGPVPPPRERDTMISAAHQLLLDELGPAYAIFGPNRELTYTGGNVQAFLQIQTGAPSLDLLSLAHPDLRMELRALWHRMVEDQQEVVRDRVGLTTGTIRREVRMIGRPMGKDRQGDVHYLIVFWDLGEREIAASQTDLNSAGDAAVQALEAELRSTKEYLQTVTGELESSNEELKSANEELMSMNEELQSSNEELETSKEELQSVNEELETVNSELTSKVEQLARTNADLNNFLESTEIATLFLDRKARIRRFTPVARAVFNLIDTDIGRPISDISARVADVDLAADVESVLDKLVPVEREVSLRDGNTVFIMRLLPYRSPGDVVDGVVATFVDVTGMKRAQNRISDLNSRLQAQIDDLSTLLDLAPIGIAFADDRDCTKISLNAFARSLTGLGASTAPPGFPDDGYTVLQDGQVVANADLPLQTAWRTARPVHDFRGRFVTADGEFEMLMSAAPILGADGEVRRAVAVFSDITPLVTARAAAETRAEQHAYVARLGGQSLAGATAEELIAEIPERLAAVLHVDFAKVLLRRFGTDDFVLMSQHGFDPEAGPIVPGGLQSQAGYTLSVVEPVIVTDLATDPRFQGPALLRDAGVVSGLSVVVGDPRDPLGVVGVHTRTRRDFTEDDKNFVQSVANLIASALRRDSSDRQKRLLLEELRHRVKNLLATVQSVASLSLRETGVEPAVRKRITDRLQALALAHDLNFRRVDDSVDLRELIETQCLPFDPTGKRISIQGVGRVELGPSVAIDASMVIHELVTNAVKHGALASEDGQVRIVIDGAGTKRWVSIDWSETGAPAADGPTREGSGTRLLKAIGAQPTFEIDMRLDPAGLRCKIGIRAFDEETAAAEDV